MALTAAQIDALITKMHNALSTALDNPKANYSIGARQVGFGEYINMLTNNLKELQGMAAGIPSENIVDFDSDISNEGTDNTEYEGDN